MMVYVAGMHQMMTNGTGYTNDHISFTPSLDSALPPRLRTIGMHVFDAWQSPHGSTNPDACENLVHHFYDIFTEGDLDCFLGGTNIYSHSFCSVAFSSSCLVFWFIS